MYKIVVFDLDGTLVNSLFDIAENANKALDYAGLKTHTIDDYKYFVGNGIENMLERAIGIKNLTPKVKETVSKKFYTEYELHSNDHTRTYDGCPKLLNELSKRGIKTAVLTNKTHELVQPILDLVFPGYKFSTVWGKKEGFNLKPDPQSLLALLKELSIKPSECLYIGDSEVDAALAVNANVDMLGALWGYRTKQEILDAGAKIVIESPNEVLEYIK